MGVQGRSEVAEEGSGSEIGGNGDAFGRKKDGGGKKMRRGNGRITEMENEGAWIFIFIRK